MYPPSFHPSSGNQQKSLAAVDFHASLEATRCHRDECAGGLGFLVGNGWVNCFTKTRFCRVLDGRDYMIYVFFISLTSMTCQSLMQVIYMSDSEDEELEASLVLQVIPELEPF